MNRQFVMVFLLGGLLIFWSSSVMCGNHEDNLTRKYNIPFDMNDLNQLQQSVDEGHQPWRLDPVDAAPVESSSYTHEHIDPDNCELISESEADASVKCQGKRTYIVHLKKLVKIQYGIWTATSVEVLSPKNKSGE